MSTRNRNTQYKSSGIFKHGNQKYGYTEGCRAFFVIMEDKLEKLREAVEQCMKERGVSKMSLRGGGTLGASPFEDDWFNQSKLSFYSIYIHYLL